MVEEAPPAIKERRWPIALLVGITTAVLSALLCFPVADWATKLLGVSDREGGRGVLVVCIWLPLTAIIGFVIGFTLSLFIKGSGSSGYAKRQGSALAVMAALIGLAALFSYASVDHPPLLDGKHLALEVQVRVPRKGRTLAELKTAGFNTALVVSVSDRSYSDVRWNEATEEADFITIPAWAALNSKNAGREITAGVENESRQIFNVMLLASPKKIDAAWSEWSTPRQRFDGSQPAPEDQYLVRYRVKFAAEYSPAPSPD